ncbi:DUF1269 domain-containing protein [Ochrobactrum soli]|uniref:Membrane protein of uknown function UCP014873 n=1 Tax=Ochrobactrum soli TaxID=2448455 RepID=A0A2P9HEV2_9HYPH|nr:DUF1269 domain-containing protein [[Ochrobactrum] soli]SPL62632.1 hypothetical protein OHAE_5239 [[Ochrobactrum] soli]
MSELVAVAFDNPDEADRALTKLAQLEKEYLVDLADAVVVIRGPNNKVRLKQSVNLVGAGAASGVLWGGLWGMLVGLLFLNPLAGFVVGGVAGAAGGALSGSLADYGIDDNFIKSVAQSLKPDSSALFVLIRKAQPEKVLAEVEKFKGHVLRTSLSPEQESKLSAALSGSQS